MCVGGKRNINDIVVEEEEEEEGVTVSQPSLVSGITIALAYFDVSRAYTFEMLHEKDGY